MSINQQEFSALGHAQLDKAVRFSSILLGSVERFAQLQLDLSRKLLADNAQAIKSLAEVKDAKSLTEWQSAQAQPTIDQAFSVARNVYDASVATQNEIAAFLEEQVAELNKNVIGGLDRFAKNAPAGSDVAVNAVKSFINTTNAAFESVSKTAKKVGAELAEAGVEAATHSAQAATAAVARKKPVASGANGAA
ncbi:phasin family protein [Crenobacter luteus]|uniref:Phasin n=1 Tax=Crenobacter luteus TaxID=1452487 RepID=A0A163CG18_9NEIS|nr:phasin family protein [Crenobacter luteus]KZE31786.1 phasin [Crenobacter luteus]TCP15652.1 phasin family protein [Crenobacter luteus]